MFFFFYGLMEDGGGVFYELILILIEGLELRIGLEVHGM